MNADELCDSYEQLRRWVIESGPGGRDGLAVLRQQGLHAWIAIAVTVPQSSPRTRAPTPPAMDPLASPIDRPPLVHLCTDMLLTTLTHPIPKEIPKEIR